VQQPVNGASHKIGLGQIAELSVAQVCENKLILRGHANKMGGVPPPRSVSDTIRRVGVHLL